MYAFLLFFLVIRLMNEYHQGLSMIGFKFKIYFVHSQYSEMIVYEILN